MVQCSAYDVMFAFNFIFAAKYKTPNVTIKSDDIKHGTLRCNTDGGYPKGQLRWFDEQKTELKPSGEMEATQTESGLFQLSSRLALLNGSTFSEYSCVVFSASGDREDEKNLTIQYMPKKEGICGFRAFALISYNEMSGFQTITCKRMS